MGNAESNPGRKSYHSQDLKRLIFKEAQKKNNFEATQLSTNNQSHLCK